MGELHEIGLILKFSADKQGAAPPDGAPFPVEYVEPNNRGRLVCVNVEQQADHGPFFVFVVYLNDNVVAHVDAKLASEMLIQDYGPFVLGEKIPTRSYNLAVGVSFPRHANQG